MSRRHQARIREIAPDIKYNSALLGKFINNIMKQGKKELAEKVVYKALVVLTKKHKTDAFEAFNSAINNVRPHLEMNSVRVGGANYQVPCPIDERRGNILATRWIITAARKRSEKTMIEKLAEELFEASNNRGGAVKTREDTHKMAEANKAFAHFSPKRSRGK